MCGKDFGFSRVNGFGTLGPHTRTHSFIHTRTQINKNNGAPLYYYLKIDSEITYMHTFHTWVFLSLLNGLYVAGYSPFRTVTSIPIHHHTSDGVVWEDFEWLDYWIKA